MNIIESLVDKVKNLNKETLLDIAISVIVIALFFMISNLISYVIIRLFSLKEKDKKKIKQNAFYKPLSRIIKVTGIYIAVMLLNLSTEANITLVKLYKIALIICVSNGLADIFNPKSIIFEKLEEKTKYNGDKQLNNFVSKIAKAVIYFVAIYLVLLELGYNLGGLVTGLGISSVIIAFAAQDIAKNLFGGFAIITDKPFSVGDWIEVGDYSGTVIDITFRSTKIKATDNTVITINNSTVVESFVKNWGNIDKRRYSTTLNLPLNTSEATVKRLLKKIEFALKTNPQIVPDSIQVHFENIKLEGIQIFIYLNSTQTGYDDFEAFKDGVNLEILKVLESENVKLSYPGQNIYIKENQWMILKTRNNLFIKLKNVALSWNSSTNSKDEFPV